ncbi:MAG TPA: efflux transporter outer membrane subunit [Candidatus Aquabacterium excrementipullorum]|nr:efflux transporter outer membrane subunit [Candidatus Aquabacterium excrementipullorum]
MNTRLSCISVLLAMALAGCATLDHSTNLAAAMPVPATLTAKAAPAAAVPAVHGDGPVITEGSALPDWHQVVTDARLQRLIDRALLNNRDLRLAALNIDKARATYRISEASLLPTVNASAGGSATRTSAAVSNGSSTITRQLDVSLGVASWELDLWGRLRELKASALATYLGTEQTRQSVQSTLIAEVSQAWLTLAADQSLARLAEQTHAGRQQTLSLTSKRRELGAVSALDVATAEAAVQTARGDLATARAQVTQDLNALRLLVGEEPAADLLPGATESQPVASLLKVPAELPSTVLLQRPDVRAAELSLQAAKADVGAARAALFPTISLTTSIGQASTGLNSLFSSANRTWSFAPSISLPVFDGGTARANLQIAQVEQSIQLATYEQTVQTAFKEAADALAVRGSLDERLAAQQAQVRAYEETVRLTQKRQALGMDSSLAVLTAQLSLYSAQQNLISLQLTEQVNRLTLFKVLGGA